MPMNKYVPAAGAIKFIKILSADYCVCAYGFDDDDNNNNRNIDSSHFIIKLVRLYKSL